MSYLYTLIQLDFPAVSLVIVILFIFILHSDYTRPSCTSPKNVSCSTLLELVSYTFSSPKPAVLFSFNHIHPPGSSFQRFSVRSQKIQKPSLKFLLPMGTYFTRPGTSAGKVFLNSALIGPTRGLLSWHTSPPHRK